MPFDAIAERAVECVFPDGSSRVVLLRVGRPAPAPEMDWCCRVAADGLGEIPARIDGVDSWQALQLALRFLEATVQHAIDEGVILHWPPGDSRRVGVAELFGRRAGNTGDRPDGVE